MTASNVAQDTQPLTPITQNIKNTTMNMNALCDAVTNLKEKLLKIIFYLI